MGILKYKFALAVTLASAIVGGVALGGGGAGVGNGGDTIQLSDGTWRLADPYVVPATAAAPVHYSDFNPNITHEVELVGQLLVRLGAAVTDELPPQPPGVPPMTINQKNAAIARLKLQGEVSRTAQPLFVTKYMADSNISYYLVDQLPAGCWTPGDVQVPPPPTPVPSASPAVASAASTPTPAPSPVVIQAGCTQGSSTYLIKSVFDNMAVKGSNPADPREQVKFLYHERIHAIDIAGEEPSYIADFTNGIDVLLDLHFAEQAGQRPVLSDDQMQALRTLIERIGYTYNSLTPDPTLNSEEFQDGGEWHLSANGGGLYSSYATVASDAYVGVGSLLSDGGSLGSGATMIDSSCYLVSCVLGSGASLINSAISPNVSSRPNSPQEVQPGDSYDDELFSVQLGSGSLVSGVTLKMDMPVTSATPAGDDNAPPPTEISIGNGASLQKVEVSAVTGVTIGTGAILSNDELDFNVNDSASTALAIGDKSGLADLVSPIRATLSNGATSRSLTFTGALDFPSGPPCAAPLTPALSSSATIGAVAAFSSLCANPVPSPVPGPGL